jgi:hypothetical protein
VRGELKDTSSETISVPNRSFQVQVLVSSLLLVELGIFSQCVTHFSHLLSYADEGGVGAKPRSFVLSALG